MKCEADNGFIHALMTCFTPSNGMDTQGDSVHTRLLKVLAKNSQNGHLQHIQLRGYAVVTYCTSLLWANI